MVATRTTPEFRLLGPLEVRAGGAAVRLGGPKERALLLRLLLELQRVVPLERLVEDVWGEGHAAGAQRSARVYVSTLRRRIGPVIHARAGGYVLDVEGAAVDTRAFEQLVTAGRDAYLAGRADEASRTLRRALALWRGAALADVRDEEWAQPEVRRLDELRIVALEERIEADLALGRHAAVLGELEALVAAQPYRERLRGQLMLALYRSGRQADALAEFRAARTVLVEELGIEPGRELTGLQAAILRQEARLAVEPEELRRRRRLPAPLTPVIGRRREIDAVKALLSGSARLVTLVGPGGTGKTRIALQAAHELAVDFPDGVVFVDLAPVRDPALVPDAIARALQVREQPGRSRLEVLSQHVEGLALLVVADNFEHVDAAAPTVSRLLAAGGEVRALVTSRSPLAIYGEHRFEVSPLELEDEAVPLFVARARAVAPGFRPSRDVADVCERLDRLPLAIELAAGRAADLGVEAMLAALPRLELATSGPRDLQARQRTLRDAIAWSVGLLPAELSATFARLGVFVGGWSASAAVDVAGASPADLSELGRRSLVVDAGARSSMLETIREYALELLAASGQADTLAARHAEHFLRLAEEADAALNDGDEQAAWLDGLEEEHGNLRAALAWAIDAGQADLALRLAVGLGRFWEWRGHVREGAQWVERALALGGHGELRVRALLRGSVFAHLQGDLSTAERLATELLEAAGEHGDRRLVANALRKLATIAKDAGEPERATALHAEALAVSRALGDLHGVSSSLMNLADVALAVGDHQRAGELAGEAVVLARELRDPMREVVSLLNLALAALGSERAGEAAAALSTALELCVRLRYDDGLAFTFETLAALEARAGNDQPAARLLGAAARMLGESGTVLEAVEQRLHDETLRALRERCGEAALGQAVAAGRLLETEAAIADAREALARSRGAPAPPS